MWKRSRSHYVHRAIYHFTGLRNLCDRREPLQRFIEGQRVEPSELDPRQVLGLAVDQTKDRPSDLCQLNRLGDLLARAGRLEPGIALFERVARAYADDGFWAKAIAIYRKILRYDPTRSDIECQLAGLYQRSGLPIST